MRHPIWWKRSRCARHRLNLTLDIRQAQLFKLYTGLFISPSGISELDCATIKTDTAEKSISIGWESLQVFLVLGALAYFQFPPLGGSRDEKWRSQWIRKRSVSWNLPKLSELWLATAYGPGRPVRFAAHRQPLCWNSCTIHEFFCL